MSEGTKDKVIDFLAGVLTVGMAILVAYACSYYFSNSSNTKSNHTQRKSSNSSGITNPSSRYYDPIDEDEPSEDDVYYENCSEARADGAESIREGEPGYREELDRDGDGIACEPWHGR